MINQIPDNAPTLIDRLLIQRPIIPYDDLAIKGQRPTYLELGKDIGLTMSVLLGMGATGPIVVPTTRRGALEVASVGGGFDILEVHEQNLSPPSTLDVPFSTNPTAISIACDSDIGLAVPQGLSFIPRFKDGNPGFMQILPGEQWTFGANWIGVFLANTTAANLLVRIWCFGTRTVADTIVLAKQN